MKIKLLVLVLSVGFLFSSCSDEDNAPLKINQQEVTLRYNEEFLFAVENANATTWSSSDEFVGTIGSDGIFEAQHIGETSITATVGNGQKFTAKVIVEPTITGVIEPYLQFGKRKPDIKVFERRQLADETPGSLFYTEPSTYTWGARYVLKDNLLEQVDLLWNYSKIDESVIFYTERYELVSTSGSSSYFRDKTGRLIIRLNGEPAMGVTASYSQNNVKD